MVYENYDNYEDAPNQIDNSYSSNSVSPPASQEAEGIGIIREMSPKKVMEQIRMNMKGYSWDYEQDKYIRVNNPLMNELGISKYLSIIGSVVTDLLTFSAFKEEEIAQLVLYVCDKAIPTIHVNWREYGIKDKSDLQIIDIQIFNLTNSAFHKAIGGGDRSLIRGTVSEAMMHKNYEQGGEMQQRERGFLSRLNPFR